MYVNVLNVLNVTCMCMYCMYSAYCMYCMYCMYTYVSVCISYIVCIVCIVCMCLYWEFHKLTYIHINTIHAHTDICTLGCTYALYVYVHMYTSNTCNITCFFQYIHICTGRITDGKRGEVALGHRAAAERWERGGARLTGSTRSHGLPSTGLWWLVLHEKGQYSRADRCIWKLGAMMTIVHLRISFWALLAKPVRCMHGCCEGGRSTWTTWRSHLQREGLEISLSVHQRGGMGERVVKSKAISKKCECQCSPAPWN
jgi:hypothetical protein